MRKLCIIPCGQKKIWDESNIISPAKAKYVYTGSFSKMCKQYAEKFHFNNWCILSAKYGFLFPDDIVPGPYNVSFNSKKTNPILIEDLKIQAHAKELFRYDGIVVLGGKNYANIVIDIFTRKKVNVPLKGCAGIGYMMGKLKSAIQNNESLV